MNTAPKNIDNLKEHYTALPFAVRFCIDTAAQRHRVTWRDILRQTNEPKYVKARHTAMRLIHELEHLGVPTYGPKRIGDFVLRHHSTVKYGVRRAYEREAEAHAKAHGL